MANAKKLLTDVLDTYVRRADNTAFLDNEEQERTRLVDEAISGQGLSTDPLDEKYQALKIHLFAFLTEARAPVDRYSDRGTVVTLAGGLTSIIVGVGSTSLFFNENSAWGLVTGLLTGAITAYAVNKLEIHTFEREKKFIYRTYKPRLEGILISTRYKTAEQVLDAIDPEKARRKIY